MPIEYVAKRALQLLLIVFVAVTINFLIPRLIPGDPVESALQTKMAMTGNVNVDVQAVAAAYRAKFGLDKPLWLQYVNYWGSLLNRDLGVSLVDFPQPVVEKIQSAVPWTLALLSVSTVISFFLGSILGALIAWPRAPRVLHVLVPPFMLLSSVPFFLLGIVLLFTFSVIVPWFPPGGGFDPVSILRLDVPTVLDLLYHAILPSLALVLGSIGFWGLGMRAMMVSVLGEDHITFAESKGLPPERVFLWYGMRNALLPQVTSLAIALGSILSGAVLVEVIFNYPGLGGILFLAIAGKDYFVIQGIVLMLILALALSLFVVDLIYPLIDPRIRYHP
ncbi:MAG: ABC transporter permease [Chloroflexi bacterium]|nr:MAG: ABC transporter permease [Chloroflexota bacterium]